MIADYIIGCPCQDVDLEVCIVCGLPPGEGECEDEPCQPRPATDEEKAELRPVRDCAEHGWCNGCSSSSCADCAQ